MRPIEKVPPTAEAPPSERGGLTSRTVGRRILRAHARKPTGGEGGATTSLGERRRGRGEPCEPSELPAVNGLSRAEWAPRWDSARAEAPWSTRRTRLPRRRPRSLRRSPAGATSCPPAEPTPLRRAGDSVCRPPGPSGPREGRERGATVRPAGGALAL